ncbi:MAG: hypothetical protein AB7P21_14465 [Lautropia sp.]
MREPTRPDPCRTRSPVRACLATAVLIASTVAAGCSEKAPSPDLDRVLDVTMSTLTATNPRVTRTSADGEASRLARRLSADMKSATPPVYPGRLAVVLKDDGSFQGFEDKNANEVQDAGERRLFTVEIDAERGRLIATDESNTVRDHPFSSAGLLTGMLVGNLLNRQKAAGVAPASLATKVATAPRGYASARSHAGSGSHASGK